MAGKEQNYLQQPKVHCLLGFGGLVESGGAVMHFLTFFLFPVPLDG
jgi:hypothetical protein